MPIYELQTIRIGKPYAYDETTKARRREEKNLHINLDSNEMLVWSMEYPYSKAKGSLLACLLGHQLVMD